MSHILINLNLKYEDLAIKEIQEYIKNKLEKVRLKYKIIKISPRIILITIDSKKYSILENESPKSINKKTKETIKLIKRIKLSNLSLIKDIDIILKVIDINNIDLNNKNNNKNNNNDNNNDNISKLYTNKNKKNESKHLIAIYKNNLKIYNEYKFNFFNYQKLNKETINKYKNYIFEIIKTKRKANLEKPKTIINIYFENNTIIISKNIIKKKKFNFKMNKLPGFMPTVTDPLLSNALFNISNIKKKTIILDPFCGIGGFFIKNLYPKNYKILNELHKNVIEKLKLNLKYLKVRHYKLINFNGLELSEKKIIKKIKQKDIRIITDIPYGKSCKMTNTTFEFFNIFLKDSIKYTNEIIIILPIFKESDTKKYETIISKNKLKIEIKHIIFVNKSLSKLLLKLTKK